MICCVCGKRYRKPKYPPEWGAFFCDSACAIKDAEEREANARATNARATERLAKEKKPMTENFEHKLCVVSAQLRDTLTELQKLKRDLAAVHAGPGEVWHWQGDENDRPANLTCPVVMHPETLRELLAVVEAARRASVTVVASDDQIAERGLTEATSYVEALDAWRVLTDALKQLDRGFR